MTLKTKKQQRSQQRAANQEASKYQIGQIIYDPNKDAASNNVVTGRFEFAAVWSLHSHTSSIRVDDMRPYLKLTRTLKLTNHFLL